MRNGLLSLVALMGVVPLAQAQYYAPAPRGAPPMMIWPTTPPQPMAGHAQPVGPMYGPALYPAQPLQAVPPSYVPPSGMYGPLYPPGVRPMGPMTLTPQQFSTSPAIPKTGADTKSPAPLPLAKPGQQPELLHQPQPKTPKTTEEQPLIDIVPGTPLIYEPDDVPSPYPSHENNPPNVAPRGYRVYGHTDYWFLWTKKHHTPPLVSTGDLGLPGSRIVLDDLSFDNQERTAGRGTVGVWLDPRQTIGVETGGFWMAERSPDFHTRGLSLARPFLDTANKHAALLLGVPGIQAGAVRVEPLQQLWSGDANLRFELYRDTHYHWDLIAGFRHLELTESLQITDRTTHRPGIPVLGGTSIATSDRFGTRNRFYGGQIGTELELHWGRFFVDMSTRLALGSNQEVVNIGGTTVITQPGGAESAFAGGLFAQPTNSGHRSRDEFIAIPEFNIVFGMQLTTHLRATMGYSLVYINNVIRPGDQIDRVVNTTQRATPAGPGTLVGEARPRFDFRDTDFWAQGLIFGLEFRY